MIQIAIIGTGGSGKTIFSTVWAKRMADRSDTDVGGRGHLEPKNWATKEYVNDVFATLNHGQWWRSTEVGIKFDLEWTLHIDNLQVPVKLIDSAGHDLKSLFLEDTYKTEVSDSHLAELLEYIRCADIVIFTVNLQHFRGEYDGKARWRNESVYEEAIKMIAKQGKQRKIAVAWTAWDLYKNDIEKEYGGIEEYVEQELTDLHNAVLDARKSGETICFFTVAPVWDTVSEKSGDTAFRIPKTKFTSYGLDVLSNWIADTVRFTSYQESAKHRNPIGMSNLGWCYSRGKGVVKDEQQGFLWFGRAAIEGELTAQWNLGVCYRDGRGTDINVDEAKKWFRKAAEQGNEKARNALVALETKCNETIILNNQQQ